MENCIIKLDNVSVGYNKKSVLQEVSLELRPGDVYTLIGPNGAGKSTLLKSVVRQLKLKAGCIYLNGNDMTQMSEKQTAQSMTMLSTERIHTELMSCYDVVATGRYPYTGKLGILSEQDRQVISKAMRQTNVTHIAEQDFMEISDGQRQRVMLARALCQEPDVLILDEPTSFLDVRYKIEILSLIRDMARKENIAILMSLHELDLARLVSDVLVCVSKDGEIRLGKPSEVFSYTDGYIEKLYGMKSGSYNPVLGQALLPAVTGKSKYFVIAGGGTGIPVFHLLQSKMIPFATGILYENDIDYPTAKELTSTIISQKAFEVIEESQYEEAVQVMNECEYVICTLSEFGTLNETNQRLYELAKTQGKLKEHGDV